MTDWNFDKNQPYAEIEHLHFGLWHIDIINGVMHQQVGWYALTERGAARKARRVLARYIRQNATENKKFKIQ